ncbi:MAG: hypothetical protein R6U97_01955 [Desulfosalsimonas sp.]
MTDNPACALTYISAAMHVEEINTARKQHAAILKPFLIIYPFFFEIINCILETSEISYSRQQTQFPGKTDYPVIVFTPGLESAISFKILPVLKESTFTLFLSKPDNYCY